MAGREVISVKGRADIGPHSPKPTLQKQCIQCSNKWWNVTVHNGGTARRVLSVSLFEGTIAGTYEI